MIQGLRAFAMIAFVLVSTGCGRQSDTIVAIAPHPKNPEILYVATNESLYKSRDGANTWNKVTTDLSSFRVLSLGIDPFSFSYIQYKVSS